MYFFIKKEYIYFFILIIIQVNFTSEKFFNKETKEKEEGNNYKKIIEDYLQKNDLYLTVSDNYINLAGKNNTLDEEDEGIMDFIKNNKVLVIVIAVGTFLFIVVIIAIITVYVKLNRKQTDLTNRVSKISFMNDEKGAYQKIEEDIISN